MNKSNAFLFLLKLIAFNITMAQTPDYEVLDGFDKIETLLKKNQKTVKDFSTQLKYNLAWVYDLSNGEVLVSSNNGLQGVWFKNKKAFQEMLEKKFFPVSEPKSVFAPEREYARDVSKNLDRYLNRLAPLQINSIPEPKNIEDSLRKLSKQINLIGKDKIVDSVYVALGIFLAEIIRREVNGAWKFRTEMNLNPYYIPFVQDSQGVEILVWKRLSEHWNRRGSVSLKTLKSDILKTL